MFITTALRTSNPPTAEFVFVCVALSLLLTGALRDNISVSSVTEGNICSHKTEVHLRTAFVLAQKFHIGENSVIQFCGPSFGKFLELDIKENKKKQFMKVIKLLIIVNEHWDLRSIRAYNCIEASPLVARTLSFDVRCQW
jgi:hypothetical protein